VPTRGLKGQPVFFHEQEMLNHLYYLSDANLLRLGPETDAAFAEYERGQEKAKLLLVRYRGDSAAARRAFIEEYLELKPARGPQLAQLEDGLWAGIGPPGRTLRLVFDATSRETALHYLSAHADDERAAAVSLAPRLAGRCAPHDGTRNPRTPSSAEPQAACVRRPGSDYVRPSCAASASAS
jgi:hypothetical protein